MASVAHDAAEQCRYHREEQMLPVCTDQHDATVVSSRILTVLIRLIDGATTTAEPYLLLVVYVQIKRQQ